MSVPIGPCSPGRFMLAVLVVLSLAAPLLIPFLGDAVPSSRAGYTIVFNGPGTDTSYRLNLSLDRKISSVSMVLHGSLSGPQPVFLTTDYSGNTSHKMYWGTKTTIAPVGAPSNFEQNNVTGNALSNLTASDDHYVTDIAHIPGNTSTNMMVYQHFKFNTFGLGLPNLNTISSLLVQWEGTGKSTHIVNYSASTLFIWKDDVKSWFCIDNKSAMNSFNDFNLNNNITSEAPSYIGNDSSVNIIVIGPVYFSGPSSTNLSISSDRVSITFGWSVQRYPSDISLDLGADGSKEWSRAGPLNGTINVTNDQVINAAVQELINAGGPGPGKISSTVGFQSSSAGTLDVWFYVTYAPLGKPTFKPIPGMSLDEDTVGSMDLLPYAQDEFGPQNLTFAIVNVSDPHIAVIIDTDGHHLNVVPSANWNGIAWFRAGATNRFNVFGASPNISIIVKPVNDPPVLAQIFNYSIKEGERFQLQLNGSDIDGDKLQYYDNTPLFDVDKDTGRIDFVAPENTEGDHWITIRVTDGKANATRVFELIINEVDVPPVFGPFSSNITAYEDSMLNLKFNATNPEGTSITYSADSAMFHIDPVTGVIRMNLTRANVGTYSINVMATANNLTANMTFHLRVLAVNHPPTIISIGAKGVDGTTTFKDTVGITFTSKVSDKDGVAAHRYMWSFANGSALSNKTTFTANISAGNYTIEFTVYDGNYVVQSKMTIMVIKTTIPPIAPPPKHKAEPAVSMKTAAVATVSITIVVIAAGAFVAGTEIGKFGFFFFLAPLFSRIKPEEALDSFTRGKVYGAILTEPGISYNMLKEITGVGNGTLAHHLRMLEETGFVGIRRDGLFKRFYPKEMSIPKDHKVISRIQRLIVSTIKEHPGMSETDVAEAIAVRRQVVNYHLKKLESMNLVMVNKEGNAVRCFANDAEIERSSVDLGYVEMEPSAGEEV